MKTDNILLTADGIVKIADFGLARQLTASPRTPSQVVSLWYRAPEILLGDQNYSTSVDLWSVGCIMAEFWLRGPLLRANTEQEQLHCITKLCGPISPNSWPEVKNLKLYGQMILPAVRARSVQRFFNSLKNSDELATQLLDSLLQLNPENRCDVRGALDHDFFWSAPVPGDLKWFMEQIKGLNLNN